MAGPPPGFCLKNGLPFCCADYDLTGNICERCPPGQQSKLGDWKCTWCDVGFFGPGCSRECTCEQGFQCDPRDGTCFLGNSRTTKFKDIVVSGYSSTIQTGTVKGFEDSLGVNVLTFGMILGASLLFIAVAILVVCIIKKRHVTRAHVDDGPPEEPSHYQYIRDDQVSAIPLSIQHQKDSSNKTPSSEGYLNPYQPLASGWEAKRPVYNETSESGVPSGDGYLHPYQPLESDWEAKRPVYNDTSESAVPSGDGYLHPNQPLESDWEAKRTVYNDTSGTDEGTPSGEGLRDYQQLTPETEMNKHVYKDIKHVQNSDLDKGNMNPKSIGTLKSFFVSEPELDVISNDPDSVCEPSSCQSNDKDQETNFSLLDTKRDVGEDPEVGHQALAQKDNRNNLSELACQKEGPDNDMNGAKSLDELKQKNEYELEW